MFFIQAEFPFLDDKQLTEAMALATENHLQIICHKGRVAITGNEVSRKEVDILTEYVKDKNSHALFILEIPNK